MYLLDDMMQKICKYPNGTYLRVEWGNGQLILDGRIDTLYESDNGLEEGEQGYKEYHACAFMIEKIDKNMTDQKYHINQLIEISIDNQPTSITLQDGSIVWREEMKNGEKI